MRKKKGDEGKGRMSEPIRNIQEGNEVDDFNSNCELFCYY